jgi:hypothetical protein
MLVIFIIYKLTHININFRYVIFKDKIDDLFLNITDFGEFILVDELNNKYFIIIDDNLFYTSSLNFIDNKYNNVRFYVGYDDLRLRVVKHVKGLDEVGDIKESFELIRLRKLYKKEIKK